MLSSPLSDQPSPLVSALLAQAEPPVTIWDWEREARPNQLPPPGDWFVWMIMAGRGWGKTRTGAEWLAREALTNPGRAYAVLARTTQDGREVCLEDSRSGLLKALGLEITSREYNRTTGEIRLANGTVIYSYTAERPDRMRGPNLNGAWCDEVGAWSRGTARDAWDRLIPALRNPEGQPRIVVTTTPRIVPLVRDLVARDDGSLVLTRGTTFENAANLSGQALDELRRRYEGTRIGRQELYGELLEEIEGALWNRAMLEHRASEPPDLERVVVAIDPAVTSGEESDDTGIVVAGRGTNGHAYVLADRTCHLPPDQWAKLAVAAYREFDADRVVAEVNNGGDLVETVLRTQDERLPFAQVRASRGKRTRAEPIAALYEQGKVHHVGEFRDLEDELCSWTPGDADSPDRLDALVWALTELMMHGGPGRMQVPRGELPRRSQPMPRTQTAQIGSVAGRRMPPRSFTR
ncbi:MAG TPA: terminase family protein [Solirubrobacteraceae bacterium]|nr:terminase family protein [Solirubrobacteraceae bacterium]